MWPFYWHIYISPWSVLKVKVKVMVVVKVVNISTTNISQTATDIGNIDTDNK